MKLSALFLFSLVQGFTNGTIGNVICTNGNANGTIGSPNGTVGTIDKSIVPLATNGTIGKITNGTIERTPERSQYLYVYQLYPALYPFTVRNISPTS